MSQARWYLSLLLEGLRMLRGGLSEKQGYKGKRYHNLRERARRHVESEKRRCLRNKTRDFSRSSASSSRPGWVLLQLGTCVGPALQFAPCSPQVAGWGLLPLLVQTAGNDSQRRRGWESHGLLPRLEAMWRPLP